jgi:selenocysteine lyase/cysteine desulfurase
MPAGWLIRRIQRAAAGDEADRPHSRLNVTGTIQPVVEVGKIARQAGVLFLVDAAQTANLPIDLRELPIDLLAGPGHKGLWGRSGRVFVLTPRRAAAVELPSRGRGREAKGAA